MTPLVLTVILISCRTAGVVRYAGVFRSLVRKTTATTPSKITTATSMMRNLRMAPPSVSYKTH